eukprot:gene6801-7017_t
MSGRVGAKPSLAGGRVTAGRVAGSVDEEFDTELAEVVDEDLERAHAQLAWLVASLASDIKTRAVMTELTSALVRPLVTMLRDAQAGLGSGYSLNDVIDGMNNNRQAAAMAALRSMGRSSSAVAAMINAELALQLWLGNRVDLPGLVEDWPPSTVWYDQEEEGQAGNGDEKGVSDSASQ